MSIAGRAGWGLLRSLPGGRNEDDTCTCADTGGRTGLQCRGGPRAVNHHKCSEVFWHEVIHCVASVWLNGKLDEETADALGQGVHQVLRGMGIEIDWGSMAGSSPPEACQERLKPQAEQ